MAYCIKCGAPLDNGAKFCRECGAPAGEPQGGQQNYYQNNYQQNNYRPYGDVRPVSFGQRNIAVAIILSIVTCGIFALVWMAMAADQLNEATGAQNATSGGVVVLLTIVTFGIYGIYWFYKAGGQICDAKGRRALPVDNNTAVIYLILSIFGLSIVALALLQNELNAVAAYHGAPRA